VQSSYRILPTGISPTGLSRASADYRIGYCLRAYHSVGHDGKNVTIRVGSVEGDTPYRTYRTGVTTLHG
jgi:hypothetical protein